MRIFVAALRRSPGFWATPFAIVLGYYMGVARPDLWSDSRYNTSGHVESLVVLLGPLAAGIAAWAASRSRRSGFAAILHTTPRSAVRVATLDIAAACAPWTAGYVVGAVAAFSHTQGAGDIGGALLALGFAGIAAFSTAGYALGTFGPRRFTAPAVALTVYTLLILLPQWKPDWLARLSILDDACCGINVRLRPAVVAGQFLLLAALALASLALLASRDERRWRTGAWFASACAAATASAMLLTQGGGSLTVARNAPTSPACATGEFVTVCLWPEHRYMLTAASEAADLALGPLQGLPGTPRALFERGARPASTPDALEFSVPTTAVPTALFAADVAQEMLPAPPPCSIVGGEYVDFPGASARPYVRAWLQLQANPHTPLRELGPEQFQTAVARLVKAPLSEQRAWYVAALAAQRDCTTTPPPLP